MSIKVEDLNLVLCGPILRKVNSHFVSVFVALKQAAYIELKIYKETDGDTSSPLFSHSNLDQAMTTSLALGQHLHVALIQLDLSDTAGLEAGQLYSYDIFFRESNDFQAPNKNLSHPDIDLLSSEVKHIGPSQNKLPCFSLSPQNFNQINIIHGSCRKPHGEGNDMLAALDDLLQKQHPIHGNNTSPIQYEDPIHRPHLLLLTGDQIYADDVAPALLRALYDASNALLGWKEVFRGTAFPGNFEDSAKTFQAFVQTKNQDLENIIANAKANGVGPDFHQEVSSILLLLRNKINELISELPHKANLGSNILDLNLFSLEYNSIETHLNELTPYHNTWININTSNHSFMLESLEAYFTKLKGLEGYLDFFQELGSHQHWGQIEVNTAPISTNPDPVNAVAKRVAAKQQLPKQPLVLSRIAPPQRAKEWKAFSGMTSDAMEAHLAFLGEFYMMYLFSWSDAIWPSDRFAPQQKTLPYYWEAVPNYSLMGPLSKASLIRQKEENVLEFLKSLPKVRRVLANIPTLMIFDDHEVTDDWNLNEQWVLDVNNTNKNVFGSHLLRNALAAYAIFQDWGNQPEDYASGSTKPGAQILKALEYKERQDANGNSSFRPAIVDHEFYSSNSLFDLFRLGSDATTSNGQKANTDSQINAWLESTNIKHWHWKYQAYPNTTAGNLFQLHALDTRTWRGFPGPDWTIKYNLHLKEEYNLSEDANLGNKGPAALIHSKALEKQIGQLSDTQLNIIISPAPVFGLPLLEDAVQRIFAIKSSVEEADYESWQANAEGFADFRKWLAGKAVILLSGDVHYAYTNYLSFPKKEGSEELEAANIVQLCSSSMKNETTMTEGLGFVGRAGHALELFGKLGDIDALTSGKVLPLLEGAVSGLLDSAQNISNFGSWFGETAPILPTNDQAILRYYLSYKDYSLFNFEMLLPNGIWEIGEGINSFIWNDFFSTNTAGVFERKEENQQYLIHFIRDHQTLEENDNNQRLNILKNINGRSESEIKAPDLEGHWDEMREVVGFNNFARISFKATPNDSLKVDQVAHQLFWNIHKYGAEEATEGTAQLLSYTLHEVALEGPNYWTAFKKELIRLAQQEYAWWNPKDGSKIKETLNEQLNPKAQEKLKTYYRLSGLYAKFLTAPNPDNLIWGATFVSFLIKKAQDRGFMIASERSIDLMRWAKKNTLEQHLKNPFWLYQLDDYAPEPGDLLCNWRTQAFDYADIQADDIHPMPAQCEIVVSKNANQIRTIGGNISHSTGEHFVTLDADGKIPSGTKPDPNLPGAYIAIIRIRTNLEVQ